jgi:preprotein translocase subunit SecD
MRNIWWTFVAIIVVVLAAVFIDLPGTNQVFGHSVTVNKGIDLAGGARVLLCANTTHPSSSDMSTAADVIRSRVTDGFGVTEPQVNQVGNNCISVEMPGLKNQNQVISTIGKTGYLAITDAATTSQNSAPGTGQPVKLSCQTAGCGAPGAKVGPTNLSAHPPVLQVIVPGKDVKSGSAQVAYDQAGNPMVTYSMNSSGSNAWCTYTTNHVNYFSPIVLDNKVVSDPVIQTAICGGQTEITGVSLSQAQQIVTYLNYGALPIALHVDSSQQVDATLGPSYVHDALVAGIIGFIIVALFMLLYYRLPGLLADIALLMYAATVFALFKLLGVTLTLAGIAGFILTIGMAVDANILIFERMKEELRAGKTLGAAVQAGFTRAWPSIRDSNASTIITSIILFWFGHNFAASEITGFATTLFLGVVVSMLTAVFVSRTFLRLLVLSGSARNPALYGVNVPITAAGGRVA